MINLERLRNDLINYLEEETLLFPDLLSLLIDVKYADENQLLNIAEELKFNIEDYDE